MDRTTSEHAMEVAEEQPPKEKSSVKVIRNESDGVLPIRGTCFSGCQGIYDHDTRSQGAIASTASDTSQTSAIHEITRDLPSTPASSPLPPLSYPLSGRLDSGYRSAHSRRVSRTSSNTSNSEDDNYSSAEGRLHEYFTYQPASLHAQHERKHILGVTPDARAEEIQAYKTIASTLRDQFHTEQGRCRDLKDENNTLKEKHRAALDIAIRKARTSNEYEREGYITYLEGILETAQLMEVDLKNDIIVLEKRLAACTEEGEKWKNTGTVTQNMRNMLAMSQAKVATLEKEMEELRCAHRLMLERVKGAGRAAEESCARHLQDLERQICKLREREKVGEDSMTVREELKQERLRAITLQRQVDLLPQKDAEISLLERKIRALEQEIVYGSSEDKSGGDKEDEVRWRMRRMFQAIEVEKAITPKADLSKMLEAETEEQEVKRIRRLEKLQDENWNLRVVRKWMGWDFEESKEGRQRARERCERKERGALTRGRIDVDQDLLGVGEFPLVESMLEQGKSVPSMLAMAPDRKVSIDWSVLGWKPPGVGRLAEEPT